MQTPIANYTLPAMQIPIPSYMLPAMQIVCYLVAPGTSPDFNVTNLAVDQTTPQSEPRPLPEGYVLHPDVGFAYKVYNETVNATDARRRCIEEGAQIALIDSAKKVEYIERQGHTEMSAYVGIVRNNDANMWVAVNTELPVSSIPWMYDEPKGIGACVRIYFGNGGLANYGCEELRNYVCEIPMRNILATPTN